MFVLCAMFLGGCGGVWILCTDFFSVIQIDINHNFTNYVLNNITNI